MNKAVYILLIVIFSQSCEEQPVPIPDIVIPQTDKVVLIEELTGVSCPNCPKGLAVINGILEQYEGMVVTYGIHGNLQTKPKDDSKYDFRNPDAIALEESLKPFLGKPAVAINRVLFEGEEDIANTSTEQWASMVQGELEKAQVIDIVLNSQYDSLTRGVQINAGVSALSFVPGDIQLHVAITESGLIDPQDDVDRTIPDFMHNHVLKELVTQLSGDDIARDFEANSTETRQYNYSIPAENNGEWIAENMEIVAFVTSSFYDGEVLQAATIHID